MKTSEQLTEVINRLEVMEYSEDLAQCVEDLKVIRLKVYREEAPWLLKVAI